MSVIFPLLVDFGAFSSSLKKRKKNLKEKTIKIYLSSITFNRARNYRQIKWVTVNNLYSSYSWSELCVHSVKFLIKDIRVNAFLINWNYLKKNSGNELLKLKKRGFCAISNNFLFTNSVLAKPLFFNLTVYFFWIIPINVFFPMVKKSW